MTLDTPLPLTIVSPSREHVAICRWRPRVANADLGAPTTEAAGWPILRATHEPRLSSGWRGLRLFHLPTMAADAIVDAAPVYPIGFSPDSRYVAYAVSTPAGVRLQWHDCATGHSGACALPVNALFAVTGESLATWLGSSRLLTRLVGRQRASAFAPSITESPRQRSEAGDTETPPPPDVAYFESQLAVVDTVTGDVTPVGQPQVYRNISGSPDGRYALVHRCPVSPRFGDRMERWPKYAEVWDVESAPDGHQLAYRESEPSGGLGVPEYGAPGRWYWHPLEAATLIRVGEDASGPLITRLRAPFREAPDVLYTTRRSISRFGWTTAGHLVTTELDPAALTGFVIAIDCVQAKSIVLSEQPVEEGALAPGASWRNDPAEWPRPLWNSNDGIDGVLLSQPDALYIRQRVTSGRRTITQLSTVALTPDRRVRRIYESDGTACERIAAVLGADQTSLLLVTEDRATVPFHILVNRTTGQRRPFDLARAAVGRSAGVARRVIARNTDREARVFLPFGHDPERTPLLVWIMPDLVQDVPPRWYDNQHLPIDELSPLRLLADGIAVAFNPPIPLHPLDSGEHFVGNLVERVHAIADDLVATGVAAPQRLVLGGHCIGGYATALVLAHSQRFSAGIVSGGKYNLAVTPLGSPLTAHKRLWDAPALYLERSPINVARQIRTPLLVVHGERDRLVPASAAQELFQAVTSAGGQCRFVCLPNEDHVYLSAEGADTYIAEMAAWITRHAAGAPPQPLAAPAMTQDIARVSRPIQEV